MINVNELTTQLRMLPDQALQRVAMMYKQDPYIFPMIISEGMARKKLRQAAQAQAAQPQPKVADQAVASLGYTPEEVGIGALQAPNMRGMADGGIAGYDEGALIAHNEPVVRMSDGGVARFDEGGSTPIGRSLGRMYQSVFGPSETRLRSDLSTTYGSRAGIPGMFMEQTDLDVEAAAVIDRLLPSLNESQLKALNQYGIAGIKDVLQEKAPDLYRKLDAEARARAKPPAEAKQQQQVPSTDRYSLLTPASQAALQRAEASSSYYGEAPPVSTEPRPVDPRLLAQAQSAPSARPAGATGTPAVRPAAATPPVRPAEGLQEPPSAAETAGGGAAPARVGSIYDLARPESAMAAAQTMLPTNRYETALNVMARQQQERREAAEAERERTKPTGKAREGLEKLLTEEQAGAAKEMDDAKAFALINAGLAIASGESPRALTNIAKGLGIGAQQYQAAVKELKKADRERKLMLSDIEEARRAEARGDWDKANERRDKAMDRQDTMEQFVFKANADLGVTQSRIAAGFQQEGLAALSRRDIATMQEAGATARQAREIASREGLAQAENATRMAIAGLPGTEERLIRAFGTDPVFRQAYEDFKSSGQDQKALHDLLVKIATSPGGMELLKKQDKKLYDTLQAYSTRLSGLSVQAVGSVPEGAGVRP